MGRHETEQRHLDLLRAHFRAEETFVNKALNDIGYQLPFWRVHYRASAGDLDGCRRSSSRIWCQGHGTSLRLRFGKLNSGCLFWTTRVWPGVGASMDVLAKLGRQHGTYERMSIGLLRVESRGR